MSKGEYFLDVSNWQPADLTDLVAKTGVHKSIIKVSEYEDTVLNQNREAQASTSRPIGFYHFARFRNSSSEADREINYFLANIPQGHKGVYGVVDYEADILPDSDNNTEAILVAMDKIAKAGYEPLLYISYDFYQNGAWDKSKITNKYPNSLWVARYRDLNPIEYPDNDWQPQGDNIVAWQFTSNYKGLNVDCSIWLGGD